MWTPCDVRPYAVDLADAAAIASTAQRTRDDLGAVTILINNSGIVHGGYFVDQDIARDIEPTMAPARDPADAGVGRTGRQGFRVYSSMDDFAGRAET